MPGNFLSPDGDLENLFVTDFQTIDQFAMNSSLWLWGAGGYGALGDGAVTNKSSPVQTIAAGTNWKQVASSYTWGTGAIKSDGTLWTWGFGGNGQLGDGTLVTKSSPVQVAGTDWKQISAGQQHYAAIRTTGGLWLWGLNNYGQLGTNDRIIRSSPTQTASSGNDWKLVSCGYYHTSAIKQDGTLWLWGRNNLGQLGTNDKVHRSSPVQTIAGGTNWQLVGSGKYHCGAIKTDGTLWLWGYNFYGQLGTFNRTDFSSPVQTISAGTNWKQVACGLYYTSAIKTDGTLWVWGQNNNGQLGINSITHRSEPVQTVAGGTNWKQVDCSVYSTAAIKTDGTLWTWGDNNSGQLGTSDSAKRSSPVQTVAGGTNWKQVSIAGVFTHTAATYFYDAGNLYPSS